MPNKSSKRYFIYFDHECKGEYVSLNTAKVKLLDIIGEAQKNFFASIYDTEEAKIIFSIDTSNYRLHELIEKMDQRNKEIEENGCLEHYPLS